ncbi:MAG: hypothetical protein ACLRMZ_23750 [Blautia marasmi]
MAETKAENAAELQEAAEAIRAESSTEELEEDYPQISFYELEMNTLDTQEEKAGSTVCAGCWRHPCRREK